MYTLYMSIVHIYVYKAKEWNLIARSTSFSEVISETHNHRDQRSRNNNNFKVKSGKAYGEFKISVCSRLHVLMKLPVYCRNANQMDSYSIYGQFEIKII